MGKFPRNLMDRTGLARCLWSLGGNERTSWFCFAPRIGLGGAVFVAKYISRREKLQMKVSLLGQKPLISSSSIFNFGILNTHRGDSRREYVMLFYPVFRINQLARLLIMIFSFQSRADWKVFVDKFVFIVEFLCFHHLHKEGWGWSCWRDETDARI